MKETITPELVAADYEFLFGGLPEDFKMKAVSGLVDTKNKALNQSLDLPNTDDETLRTAIETAIDPDFAMNHIDSLYRQALQDVEAGYTIRFPNNTMVYIKRSKHLDINNLVLRFYSDISPENDRVVVELFYYVNNPKEITFTITISNHTK